MFSQCLAQARRACLFIFIFASAALTGCGTFYVDNVTKEIPASQYRVQQPVHPVQVLFEFQTKGVANARATDLLKKRVLEQIQASGLFSSATDMPATGGGLLAITVNNIVLDSDAYKKGFMTGLTLGLAGNTVTDGYVCKVRYTGPDGAVPIEKEARHAIHTAIGNTGAPPNATKAASGEEAVTAMLRQVISNALNAVTQDPAFK